VRAAEHRVGAPAPGRADAAVRVEDRRPARLRIAGFADVGLVTRVDEAPVGRQHRVVVEDSDEEIVLGIAVFYGRRAFERQANGEGRLLVAEIEAAPRRPGEHSRHLLVEVSPHHLLGQLPHLDAAAGVDQVELVAVAHVLGDELLVAVEDVVVLRQRRRPARVAERGRGLVGGPRRRVGACPTETSSAFAFERGAKTVMSRTCFSLSSVSCCVSVIVNSRYRGFREGTAPRRVRNVERRSIVARVRPCDPSLCL